MKILIPFYFIVTVSTSRLQDIRKEREREREREREIDLERDRLRERGRERKREREREKERKKRGGVLIPEMPVWEAHSLYALRKSQRRL